MQQPDARVSVVMATYNGARFLEEQLQSLAFQQLLPIELVVGDDGSTDDTLDILERFSRTAPFPVTVRSNPERLGYAENFLTTARIAAGDYIAFCDQDDVWLPEKLATAACALLQTDTSLFVHRVDVIDDSGATTGEFEQGIGKTGVVAPLRSDPWGVYYGFTMVFRRDLLDVVPWNARGPHISERGAALSHDMWVYFLASSLFDTYVDRARLAHYRRHAGNETAHILKPLSLLELTSRLGKAPDPFVSRGDIARHRADLLSGGAEMPLSEQRAAAARYWLRVARLEKRRTSLYYGGRPFPARVLDWVFLVAQGAYRCHAHFGLGRLLALKDALAGVLALRRPENRATQR